MKGLKVPAKKMGLSFAGGKFDLNKSTLPLSGFTQAMASLVKQIMHGEKTDEIMAGVLRTFNQDDFKLLKSALPGCGELFDSAIQNTSQMGQIEKTEDTNTSKQQYGKETVGRIQFAIRRLLKVICTSLNGIVLFIDDLQVSQQNVGILIY